MTTRAVISVLCKCAWHTTGLFCHAAIAFFIWMVGSFLAIAAIATVNEEILAVSLSERTAQTLFALSSIGIFALTIWLWPWIRKTFVHEPLEPLELPTLKETAEFAWQFVGAVIAIPLTLIFLGAILYVGYALLTMISVPLAILIGAGLIALAILVVGSD